MEPDFRFSIILAIVVVTAFTAFALGTTLESPGPAAASQPLSIVLFNASGVFHTWVNLTLRSDSPTPIGNLSVLLMMSCGTCGYVWEPMFLQSPPNITPAQLLLLGQTASFGVGLGTTPYGPSCGGNYLTITGMYGNTEVEPSPFAMVTTAQLACPTAPTQ